MNKTKIILLAIGGVALLGTLALGFLTYNAWSAKCECDEESEQYRDDARRLVSLKILPSPESVKATDANRKAYADWCEAATDLASAGDMKFEQTTPASFKSFITDEAKRYSDLPGDIAGRFVKAGFGFGFDEYILKGALPSAGDMPRLQREWYDVSTFLNLLVDAKVTSVSELSFPKTAAVEEQQPVKGKKKGKKKQVEEKAKPDITRFSIVFNASAAALVAVENAIAANPRFIVAESVTFARASDDLPTKLGEKTVRKQETRKSRRNRRGAEESAPAAVEGEDEAFTGVVVTPATMPDFKVSMTVAVYDFRTKLASKDTKEEKEESK